MLSDANTADHITEGELKGIVFELDWASPNERELIFNSLKKMGRQTMNIRLMPDAKFLVIKSDRGKIIGWGGLDTAFQKSYPELFSLYLEPAFRKFSLGLLLESARASYLLSQSIDTAYVRMTKDDASTDLMLKRLGSEFYTLLNPASLDKDYLQLCHRCELFGKACPKQIYLKFDVAHFVAESVFEIGNIDIAQFPKRFSLIRKAELKQQKVSGEDHERLHIWRSHRPLWLSI